MTEVAGGVVDLGEEVLRALIASDPVQAARAGLRDDLGDLPSYAADVVEQRVGESRRLLRRLAPLVAHDSVDDAAEAFLLAQVVRRVTRALDVLHVHRRQPVVYLDAVASLVDLLTRETAPIHERLAALDGRLRAVPRLLGEARTNLHPRLPRPAVESCASFGRALLELTGPTVRAFAREHGRDGALDDASRRACEALADFAAYLETVLLPAAADDCAAGREALLEIVRFEHVLEDDLDDLAAHGREVLAETRAAMRQVAAGMGYADVAAGIAAVQAAHPAADDVVQAYGRALGDARDFVVAHGLVTPAPDAPLEVLPTPVFLRPLLPFAAYDPPGPFHPRQVGYYYVTAPESGTEGRDLEEALCMHPLASMPTTGAHEGYPGHHLQLTRANRAPTWGRRLGAAFDGSALFVEGWAFYCEEMMERQGFLAAPEVRLMRLNDQAWRAARVVIDVELHTGVMRFDEAVAFLMDAAHMAAPEATSECRRYVMEPGQPMSYLLGRREVKELARRWQAVHGDDLCAFHDALLDCGSAAPAVVCWGMGLGPRPPAAAAITS